MYIFKINRKKIPLIFMLYIISYACGLKHHNDKSLEQNIDIQITKKTIENCKYYCHYINFKITNNNTVGVYLPAIDVGYFEIINSYGDTITDIVKFYEDFNYYANGYNHEYDSYRERLEVKENAVTLWLENDYKQNMNKLIAEEYKLIMNAYSNNKNNRYEESIKRDILTLKYGKIIYIPPKSSLTLSESINYLFYNYMIEENYMALGHDAYKLSDSVARQFSELYENYEKTKSSEVKIIFNYIAKSPTLKEKAFYYPIGNFDGQIVDSIKLSANFPYKILDKYYLLEKLTSKDTLIIKFDK